MFNREVLGKRAKQEVKLGSFFRLSINVLFNGDCKEMLLLHKNTSYSRWSVKLLLVVYTFEKRLSVIFTVLPTLRIKLYEIDSRSNKLNME